MIWRSRTLGGASILLAALACACNEGDAPPLASETPLGSATAPSFERAADDATAPSQPAPKRSAANVSASASASLSAKPVAASTVPTDVEVSNIGIHIGGAKNTKAEKQPIREAVEKHYNAMLVCYAMIDDPPKVTTFGVDMLIPRDGGRARISNPRSGFDTKAADKCMLEVFEQVEFAESAKVSKVSYSVRFKKK